jgi:poly(3-hydroxybutyrate) depolymerase
MARRRTTLPWAVTLQRAFGSLARDQLGFASKVATRATKAVLEPAAERRKPPRGVGDWIAGVAMAPGGMRRFHLYRPPGVKITDRLPLMVMLHGCQQDAKAFAVSTRMNALAARERFWCSTPSRTGAPTRRAAGTGSRPVRDSPCVEVGILMAAIKQVCLLYPVDPDRVAVAGLSSGASMAALLATHHPERFKAVAMHSGVPPGAATSTASALRAMRGAGAPPPRPNPMAPWPPLIVIHGGATAWCRPATRETSASLWAEAAGARATVPRRAARPAPRHDHHRLQAGRPHRGLAVRGGVSRTRLERRRRQAPVQRCERPRCLAARVGVCHPSVRRGLSVVTSRNNPGDPVARGGPGPCEHRKLRQRPTAMNARHTASFAAALAALTVAAVGAQAQSTIKPGLWEQSATLKSQSGQIERAMAEAEAQIAKLPPEQRRQIEAMMKARGVSIGNGATTVRMCLTSQDIERGNIPVQAGDCTQKVLSRDSTSMKVSFSCATNPPSSGVGEVRMLSPTSTVATASVDTLVNDKPERIDTTQQGTWIADDCGDIRRWRADLLRSDKAVRFPPLRSDPRAP